MKPRLGPFQELKSFENLSFLVESRCLITEASAPAIIISVLGLFIFFKMQLSCIHYAVLNAD